MGQPTDRVLTGSRFTERKKCEDGEVEEHVEGQGPASGAPFDASHWSWSPVDKPPKPSPPLLPQLSVSHSIRCARNLGAILDSVLSLMLL